jgi:uncharacterized glyoxalase superfamily metalloenzyme YdcJ
MKIVIDFDGTCVTHEYPKIGQEIGAVPVLQELVAKGHQLILFTMRSGDYLLEAAEWFYDNDIELFGVQRDPEQSTWTDSPKAYGHLIIDDAALGCPMLITELATRPYADWTRIRTMLVEQGVL